MRTLVDIPEDDIRWLDGRAADQGRSRAAIVREAVSTYRAEATATTAADNSWIDGPGFGYWKDRDDIGDGVAYQQAIREDRTPYEDL